jgi:hypothetical protein
MNRSVGNQVALAPLHAGQVDAYWALKPHRLGNPPIGKLLNGFRSRRSTIRSAIPKGRGGIVWSTMHSHKFRNLSAISDLKTSIDNNCLSSNIA